MMRHVLASSRYIVFVAVIGTFVASVAMILYEGMVVAQTVFDVVREGSISSKSGKALAVGMIEAIDVFMIAIVAYIICLGLFALFVDDTLPLPRWLEVHDLDDLKNHLVSVVIAVLAVLFLREAVARAQDLDLMKFGTSLAVMIAALTFFLTMRGTRKK
jgi:uncharacterized membrane protein YqhA